MAHHGFGTNISCRAEARFSMTGKFISLPPLLVQQYSIVHEASALCGGGGVFDFCPQGDNLMQSGGSNRRMPEVRRFTYNDKSCLLSARKREERSLLEFSWLVCITNDWHLITTLQFHPSIGNHHHASHTLKSFS